MKKTIGNLLLQIIPVVVGVYLGFLTSSWSEGRKGKKQQRHLAALVAKEVQHNRALIMDNLAYHEMVRDTCRALLREKIDPKTFSTSFFKGIRAPKLTSGALETGLQTGVVNEFDVDLLLLENETHAFQREYRELCRVILQGLIAKDLKDDEESLKGILNYLALSMTDMVIAEEELIAKYEVLEKELARVTQ